MNRISIIAGIGAALLLGGCSKNPEPIVRERATTYTQLLQDDKFEEAINYVDPDLVTAKGRTTVTNQIKTGVGIVKGLVQLTGRKTAGFEIRKLDLSSDKTSASLQVIFFTTDANGGDRKEHPTDQRWVLKNKTWFVTL